MTAQFLSEKCNLPRVLSDPTGLGVCVCACVRAAPSKTDDKFVYFVKLYYVFNVPLSKFNVQRHYVMLDRNRGCFLKST